MLRRLHHFVVILLLLFAQQQALVHPLQHLTLHKSAQTTTPSHHSQDSPHEETCGKCTALAGLASALQSQVPFIALPAVRESVLELSSHTFEQTSALPYQSRAPPHILNA